MKRYDIDSITYFIESVGDITRWCGWDERKDILIKKVPLLDDYLRAKRMLLAIETMLLSTLNHMDSEDDY